MSLVETLLRSQPQKFGLWPSVWKLLRLRVLITWNGFKRAKTRRKVGMIFLALLLVGGMAFLFWLSSLLLGFLRSPQLRNYIDPTTMLNAIPTMVLTAAFLLTILTNFGVLLQSLYLSHDMDFLVTSPIPMRAVFLAKLLEAILPNFALFCAFSLPVLFGLGTASGYTVLYYPLLLAMLALLALAAGGMASILVMAVVRVIPARRVAEVLGFLGALVSILCGQSGNIMRAMNIEPTGNDVSATLGAFASVNTPWSPLAWAGRGLIDIGQANWLPGLALTVLSLLLAGGLFAGTLFLAEQLYYTGWASMQGSVQRRRPRRAQVVPASTIVTAANAAGAVMTVHTSAGIPAGIPSPDMPSSIGVPAAPTWNQTLAAAGRRLIPAPVRGIIVKDLLLLRRDPRNLSQLITPLILGFVMLFTGGGSRYGGRRSLASDLAQSGLSELTMYLLIVLSTFVGWMLMMNLASLAFSREGRSYWLLKAAPLRAGQMLAGKFIISYLPSVIFSLAFLLVSFAIRAGNWAFLPYAAVIVTLCIAGATSICLYFGVAGANLEWDSPQRQRLRGVGGCVMLILVLLFLGVDLLLFLLPPLAWQVLVPLLQGGFRAGIGQGFHLSSPPLLAYLLGILLGGAGALAGVIVSMRMAIPRLARIGEAE